MKKIIIIAACLIGLSSCTKPKVRSYRISTTMSGAIYINGTFISVNPIVQDVTEGEPVEVMTEGYTTLTISREGVTVKRLASYSINGTIKTTLKYEDSDK